MSNELRTRYPGYDVMRKRDTPSWDDATREVIDARLAQRNTPSFCNDVQWRTLDALCAVIVPRSRAETQETPSSNEVRQPTASVGVKRAFRSRRSSI